MVEYVNFPDPALYMIGFVATSKDEKKVSNGATTAVKNVTTSSEAAAILKQRRQTMDNHRR